MISLDNLCLTYANRTIFDRLSLTIQNKQQLGLVGRNGSGKSTLLKMIAGDLQPDSGNITIQGKKTIAYLPQEVTIASHQTIFQEAYSTFTHLQQLEDNKQSLELKIEEAPHNTELLESYARICEQLAHYNPAAVRAQVTMVLTGLGFTLNQLDNPVHSLSIGWRMRIVLAKLLLRKADFYLFDEPTNHLDIVATQWFLQFLAQSDFGFIMVCHERDVLNTLCNSILELELGRSTLYTGNYNAYEVQKKEDAHQLEQAYNQQQRDIKQKMATINRFRAKPSKAKMARSMLRSLEKIERITLPPQPKNIRLSFPDVARSGRVVLSIKQVGHAFGDKQIFTDVSFEVLRNQRVALVAPNGMGKTTLFNLIAGKLPLKTGTITYGQNVQHALFDQDQAALLDPKQTVLEAVQTTCSMASDQMIRKFLGAFLFSQDEVDKKTAVLSGGERNRLGMVRILLEQANLLLLDEPTNHLDIMSKDALLSALQSYNGTMVFVSHDCYFIEQLATSIVELTPNGVNVYQGGYSSYRYQREQAQTPNKSAGTQQRASDKKHHTKDHFLLRKKCRSLENKIERLEQDISTIEQTFATLAYGTKSFIQQDKLLREKRLQLEHATKEWEEAQSKLESL